MQFPPTMDLNIGVISLDCLHGHAGCSFRSICHAYFHEQDDDPYVHGSILESVWDFL